MVGAQVLHVVQVAAFDVVLKEPEHASHVRSAVREPPVATFSPAVQVVQATHAVPGSPSSSHVPVAHVCFGVTPPGQYVPGSHGAQIVGDVGVLAATCSVPAAHAPGG